MASDQPQHCPHCGADLPEYGTTCLGCDGDVSAYTDAGEQRSSDRLSHVAGSVYYDTSPLYLLAELPGVVLLLIPATTLVEWFPDFWLWLLKQDLDLAIWLFQNTQTVGIALLVFGVVSRIKLDPDGVNA